MYFEAVSAVKTGSAGSGLSVYMAFFFGQRPAWILLLRLGPLSRRQGGGSGGVGCGDGSERGLGDRIGLGIGNSGGKWGGDEGQGEKGGELHSWNDGV